MASKQKLNPRASQVVSERVPNQGLEQLSKYKPGADVGMSGISRAARRCAKAPRYEQECGDVWSILFEPLGGSSWVSPAVVS